MKRIMTVALVAAAMLTGCRDDAADDQMTGSITPADMQQARSGWPEELSAAIDSGNAAYRAENYDVALEQFREATRISPDVTAGWFGIYMAEHARGNIAAADSAMARVQALAPNSSLVPGDTGAGAMPPGHPAPGAMPPGHPTTTGQ